MKPNRGLFRLVCLLLLQKAAHAALAASPSISTVFRHAAVGRPSVTTRSSSNTGIIPKWKRKGSDSSGSDDDAKVFVVEAKWARFFYTITALNPILAVIFNDYSEVLWIPATKKRHAYLAKTYETIFFFARLKPRVSFAIGAILRGLQLTTALQYIFDPTAGVGFGINIICLFAHSRWPAVGTLGWSATKIFWKVLGACPPTGRSVPISISIRTKEPERKGYRMGL